MRDFIETIKSSRVVLTEGGIIERIRRNRDIELDPFIAHSGMIYEQIKSLDQSGVDFIMASTQPAFLEAMGIALALSKFTIPYIISFVVTPEGTLLDGTPVHEAIDKIDSQVNPQPFYYMINCVHPSLFKQAMNKELILSPNLNKRILGIQANISSKSPDELESLSYLDTTEPKEFADSIVELHQLYDIKDTRRLLWIGCTTYYRNSETSQ